MVCLRVGVSGRDSPQRFYSLCPISPLFASIHPPFISAATRARSFWWGARETRGATENRCVVVALLAPWFHTLSTHILNLRLRTFRTLFRTPFPTPVFAHTLSALVAYSLRDPLFGRPLPTPTGPHCRSARARRRRWRSMTAWAWGTNSCCSGGRGGKKGSVIR